MSLITGEQLKLAQNKYIEYEQIKLLLDDSVKRYNADPTTLEQIIDVVSHWNDGERDDRREKLDDLLIFSHPLFIILRDKLIELLQNWHHFNETDTNLFAKITKLFGPIVQSLPRIYEGDSEVNEDGIKTSRRLLFDEILIQLIAQRVAEVATIQSDQSESAKFTTLGVLLIEVINGDRCYAALAQKQLSADIVNAVLKCIDSTEYRTAFLQFADEGDNSLLSKQQEFLLFYTYSFLLPNLHFSLSGLRYQFWQKQSSYFLSMFIHLITGTKPLSIRPLNYAWGILDWSFSFKEKLSTLSEREKQDYRRLINDFYIILSDQRLLDGIVAEEESSLKETNFGLIWKKDTETGDYHLRVNPTSTLLISTILTRLFDWIDELPQLLTVINERSDVEQILLNLTSADIAAKYRAIPAYAYNILARIIDDNAIKQLKNIKDIPLIFVTYLKEADDDVLQNSSGGHLHVLLKSLKALLQHDEMKDEFYKQPEGLTYLVKIATDDSNSNKTHQLTMACLTLISFNKEAANVLKHNENLMKHVREILDGTKEDVSDELKTAAEGLLWKLEKEEQRQQQQAATNILSDVQQPQSLKHDLMISYSWADKELVRQIYEFLTKEKAYRVWIDDDKMHGGIYERMAEAVENSQFILVCMSETYKNSENCKSEATYARTQGKTIIPVKLTSDMKLNSWLGFLVAGLLYTDFGQAAVFETKMIDLGREIDSLQHQNTEL